MNKELIAKLLKREAGPVEELVPLSRQLAAEGSVLLKNDRVLPFEKGISVAVFGRIQQTYIKSGTGSGGGVNAGDIKSVITALRENGVFKIDEELAKVYADWSAENPLNNGTGWGTEPLCQEEMPIPRELADKFAAKNDAAVIVLGRSAGEDIDSRNEKGGFMLTDLEEEMIKNVSDAFDRVAVVLNISNLINMSFADNERVGAILNAWQGGQEGAAAIADMLSGKISPSGKLPDTAADRVEDYPADANFGDPARNIYAEDIYVGYRYFETFAPEKVRFPFGFGLTYTKFDIGYSASEKDGVITVTADVKNIGDFAAKEVIQVYYEAPCGKLGTPSRQLVGFKKTGELAPSQSETVSVSFKASDMAAYDDNGASGYKYSYVEEAGDYNIYAGVDVRSAKQVYTYNVPETAAIEKLSSALAPTVEFDRFKAVLENGKRVLKSERVSVGEYDVFEKIKAERVPDIKLTGDLGIKLVDVYNGKNTLDEFVAQLTPVQLSNLVCGEGPSSPKGAEGVVGCFGGVTDALLDFGIPVCSVADGPAGVKVGKNRSTAIPSGHCFASSFNTELAEEIYTYLGIEINSYKVDSLLGPGMNIHRHILNGRNFEYFSEDPLLCGKIAAAEAHGMVSTGCSATVKHLFCNSQELSRTNSESVVSERALREIYLRCFEIAVKESGTTSIMTSYNPVNNFWSASNYDLTETVLRREWGFEGIAMTDWWAKAGQVVCGNGDHNNLAEMLRSHNDLYMVCESSEGKRHNIMEGLEKGILTLGDLQYCAKNILTYILKSHSFERFVEGGCVKPDMSFLDDGIMTQTAVLENVEKQKEYQVNAEARLLVLQVSCKSDPIAQSWFSLTVDGKTAAHLTLSNSDGVSVKFNRVCSVPSGAHTVKCDFAATITVNSIAFMK